MPAFPLFLWRETGPIEWYVGEGYAYVHADVRGSGRSEGEFGFMDRTEQHDYIELIAWIARQPWCNGRVGGIGQSYYAMAQWLMATWNPPGLACIAPYDGLVDQYRCSNYHGGIFCSYRSSWYANLRADNQHRPAGGRGRPPMRFDLVGAITEHTLDDDWWRERSAFARLGEIKVPVLSIGHWGKMGLHLRGNILGFEGVKAPKKLVVTGAKNVHEAHHQFDQVDFHRDELLPFYEAHLKGIDNGVMDGPPVKLFVRGAESWREEPEWPLARATYVPYFLRKGPSGSVTSLNDGGLSDEPPAQDEAPTSYSYPDWEWTTGVVATAPDGRPDPVRRVLTFTSAPLAADIEVTGPIVLTLYASSDQIDTRFIVKLADQAPQVVQIANRVRGRDVRQQPAAARLAAPRKPDRLGHVAPGLQRRRRDRPIGAPEARHAPLIGKATDMSAGARAAGIQADEPPSRQPVEGRPGGAHVRRPGHAGAAEVHEQRPDPPAPVAGAIANYRQRNRRSGRHHAPGAHGGA